jgi:outer membrane immunogenic protein
VIVAKHLLYVAALLILGTISAVGDEITVRPAYFITSPLTTQHWSGVYIGGNGGYGWSNSSVAYFPNDPASRQIACGGRCIPSTDFRMDGALAGGQIGVNWQINALWLIGAEADYQWSNFEGSGSTSFRLAGGKASTLADERVRSFGTIRARMGVIAASPLLLYGTGGIAYGRINESFSSFGTGSASMGGFSYNCSAGGPSCFAGSSSQTAWGWTAGAGAELAISNNITVKTEFLYVDLSAPRGTITAQSASVGTTPAAFTATFSSAHLALVRAGVNFKY